MLHECADKYALKFCDANINMSIEYQYYDEGLTTANFGLNNTGVICWCNSLLQVLFSLPALNKVLLEYEDELRDNIFAAEYIRALRAGLAQAGALSNDNNTIPYAAGGLDNVSGRILRAFMLRLKQKNMTLNIGNGQECTDEAFTMFIDMFGCPAVERMFSNIYELSIKCPACRKIASLTRDKAYRITMFAKLLETPEQFCNYIRLHPSECSEYKCDCGHVMTNFYRTEKLKMLREIVVIMFNKFQHKDNRWFPQTLKFRAKVGHNLQYRLVGKIEHSGTMFGGHYWAHALRRGTWTKFNDSAVTAGTPEPTEHTFMLVYHIVHPDETLVE